MAFPSGSFFLTRYATNLPSFIGVTGDDEWTTPNNCWGQDEASAELCGGPWSFRKFEGQEGHPLYANTINGDNPNEVYCTNAGYHITNSTAQYHIGTDWGGYDNYDAWTGIFTYPITEGTVANPINGVEAKQEHWTKWMWNAIATYNFETGLHRGDVMIGTELNREDDTNFSGKAYDFAVLTTDYMWPNAAVGEAEAYGSGEGYSLVSFFGKANYSFADRYLLSLTVRRDGSSRFGRNRRYGTFPSVSAGWRINEEKFLNEVSWIDNLKLRASWGQTGNQEISNIAQKGINIVNGKKVLVK